MFSDHKIVLTLVTVHFSHGVIDFGYGSVLFSGLGQSGFELDWVKFWLRRAGNINCYVG